MLVTKLKGGLGNQMFQYATGFAIAQESNAKQKIDISGYNDLKIINSDTPRKFELSVFNTNPLVATLDEIKKIKYPYGVLSKGWRFFKQKILRRNYTDYHPYFIKKVEDQIKSGKDFYLDGFFQSEKNFIKYSDQIRKEFTFKKDLIGDKAQQLAEVLKKTNSISVHIRRSDYLTDETARKYWGSCSLEYYNLAIKKITEEIQNPDFYVYSDDPNWIETEFIPQVLKDYTNKVNISVLNLKPYEELFLMSQSKHNIIANSSFSWWAAWLNQNPDKIVIAPKKWTLRRPDPHSNICPESWIRI